MDLLTGSLYTQALVDVILAMYFLALGAGRRVERDYLVFGLLCGALGVYAMTCAGHYRAGSDALVMRWIAARGAAGAWVCALFLDFGVRIVGGQSRLAMIARRTMYLLAGATTVLALTGHIIDPATLHTRRAVVLGQTLVFRAADVWRFTWLTFGPLSLGVAVTTVALIRAAHRRPRGLAWIAAAGALVLAATAHDALVGLLRLPTIYLLEQAYFVFAFAVSYVLTSRLAEELSTRTAELRQLSDTLRSVRETLEKREQLAAVGELSAIVAHEIRNPLGVISNAVSSLRRAELPQTDRMLLLAILDEESARLNRIVGDLLQLARPIDPQMRPIDPAELIERAVAPARQGATEVVVNFSEHARTPLRVDGHLLRQALANLVDNAVQAMGGSGTLTVGVEVVERAGAPGREFAVIDTGEGMNTEVRSRARDPFFTTRATGTGLGLAIVERIVRAHGGQLDIQSARNKGTTVRFWLPERTAGN